MSHTTDPTGVRRTLERIRRHWRWGRQQGFGRLIEEDQLNPVTRLRLASTKRRWRRRHHVAPNAVPVYLIGLQRSGTNMIARGLEEAPEFEVRNENDRAAFEHFQLRPDPVVRELVARSGHRYVLFKPLCDSHRATQLLDDMATPSPGRAIWAYRDVDGRVRSSLAKFGASNLDALRRIAAGEGDGMWQAGGLSAPRLAQVRELIDADTSPETAAALFWYLRNALYFDLGLDRRSDVLLVSYAAMVADPAAETQRICAFLDLPYRPALHEHVDARAAGARPPLAIDPRVRALCDELGDRLEAARTLS